MELDHIALAGRDTSTAFVTLTGELGGTVLQGTHSRGFRPVQVRVGDAERGLIVELLEPHEPEVDDFLERFLVARGEGPHHITFKTRDLVAEIDRLRALGLTPVGIQIDATHWKECFLSPREAHGTVVQITQGGLPFASFADHFDHARAEGPHAEPQWWPTPPPRAATPTFVERIVVASPTPEAVAAFYRDAMLGTCTARPDGGFDLTWPGGGSIRVVSDPTGPTRIHHLEATGPGPARRLTLVGTTVEVAPTG